MKFGNKTIQYALYDRTEGGRKFVQDTTDVTRPDLEFATDTLKGAGILGEIELAALAQLKSMSHVITLNRSNPRSVALLEPKTHELELCWVTDVLDSTRGKLRASQNKEIFKAIPKKMSGGKVENGSNEGVTLELEDIYYKFIQDGESICEIDKLNNVCIINGVDYAKEIRQGL